MIEFYAHIHVAEAKNTKAALRHHFFDAHSVEKPRPNCIAKKRRRNTDSDMFEAPEANKASTWKESW